MTNQPRDLFSDVACVPYWNDTFIQAEVGEWFRLVFTEDASGSSAPVTMRLTNMGEDADCESNRCCTGPEQCSFDEPENRYTCRKPR